MNPEDSLPTASVMPQKPPSPSRLPSRKRKMSGLLASVLFFVGVFGISAGYFAIQSLNEKSTPETPPSSLTANLVPPTSAPTAEAAPRQTLPSATPALPTATPEVKVYTPAELQTHDNIRVSDLSKLSIALGRYIEETGPAAFAEYSSVNSQTSAPVRTLSCAASWIGINLCEHISQIPVDIVNRQEIQAIDTNGAYSSQIAGYGLTVNPETGGFKLCSYLESEKSIETLRGDGGTTSNLYEIGTDLSLFCSPQAP